MLNYTKFVECRISGLYVAVKFFVGKWLYFSRAIIPLLFQLIRSYRKKLILSLELPRDTSILLSLSLNNHVAMLELTQSQRFSNSRPIEHISYRILFRESCLQESTCTMQWACQSRNLYFLQLACLFVTIKQKYRTLRVEVSKATTTKLVQIELTRIYSIIRLTRLSSIIEKGRVWPTQLTLVQRAHSSH